MLIFNERRAGWGLMQGRECISKRASIAMVAEAVRTDGYSRSEGCVLHIERECRLRAASSVCTMDTAHPDGGRMHRRIGSNADRSGFLASSLLLGKGALPPHMSDAAYFKRQEQEKPGLLPTQGHHHGEQRRQWECTNRNRTTTTNQLALLWHLQENVAAVQAYSSHARLRQGQRMPVESVELKPSAVA